tara:strand:+ start:1019 stop:1183 length:165 start_codon:yes stop_codon:yes gene_type:complete
MGNELLILTKRVIKVTDDIRLLLDAIIWDAFSETDEVLEIDRSVAEAIKQEYCS